MALPPEPLDEVLPQAAWVVEAEVKQVLSQGAAPSATAPSGATSTPHKVAAQVVLLQVRRVLRGPQPGVKELTVVKPLGDYALRAGNAGPFLLDGNRPQPVILGRYGPDTYPLAKLEAALAAGRSG